MLRICISITLVKKQTTIYLHACVCLSERARERERGGYGRCGIYRRGRAYQFHFKPGFSNHLTSGTKGYTSVQHLCMYFVEIGHQCKSRNLSLTFCIIMSLFCLHNTMQLMLFRCWKTGRSNIKHILDEKLPRGLCYTIQCNDSIASFTMETD